MQVFRKRCTGEADPLPGLPLWESELLRARGMNTPEKAEKFLHPSLSDLHDPRSMQGMDRAVQLIRDAISRGDRILVYGDYDVDGICAVTVLLETLREEGAKADFRIPLRHSEGYGLNEQAVREIAADYRLLITVDCGISNVKEVRLAKESGMNVIVTDHHEVPEELPPADAVLDPLLGNYPFRRLCGAGVALKLCQALQGTEGAEKRLEAAALATVADIVPLTDENRIIVREGMRRMEASRRPGLRALIRNAGISFPMRADDIAFRLAPRLNAAGRLEDASQGVRLLMTADPAEGQALADHLEENNRARQAAEQKMLREAMEALPLQNDLRRDRVIIIQGDGWNTGLIGLVAGKLCERFHHPCIVLSLQEDRAVGSCRSIPGINIWEVLNACGDLFLRFGGHAQAAGLTVEPAKIPEMRRRLNQAIRERCDDSCFLPEREYDTELALRDVTLEMIERLESLEPVGFGNPAPVFRCRNASLQEGRRVGKDRSHLKLTLLEGETIRDGIGFGLGDLADQTLNRVDVLFRPSRNEFNGRVTPQLQVQAMEPAGRIGERIGEGTGERTGASGASGKRDIGKGAGERTGASGDSEKRESAGQGAEFDASFAFFRICLQEMTLLSAKQREHLPAVPGLRPEHLLKERMAGLDTRRETMGELFRKLKGFQGDSLEAFCGEAGVSPEQALLCLTAFEQLGLMRWQLSPFRVDWLPVSRKSDLEQSPVIRYIREAQGQPPAADA